jgi:hypothetical protein
MVLASRKTRHLLLLVMMLALLVTACIPTGIPEDPTLAVNPPTPAQTAALESTPADEPDDSSEPIPCPVERTGAPEFSSTDPLSAEEPLLAYLNTGGSIPELRQQLTSAAMIPAAGGGFTQTTINPDNLLDLVILLVDADSANLHPSGRLYVFNCTGDEYAGVYASPPEEEWFNPQIHSIQDMNSSGSAEIIFSQTWCGAHTCFSDTQILGWQNDRLSNLLEGTTEDLPFPVFEILTKPDAPAQLIVSATAMGSVGAGPFQPYQRHWEWNNSTERFEPGDDILLASNYRVHVLYAAEDLLIAGKHEEAISGYERVITDNTLSEWADPERERAILEAFAHLRILQAHLLSGDLQKARNVHAAFPDLSGEDPGQAFITAAGLFLDAFQETQDLDSACQALVEFAEKNRSKVIEPLYFGYANRIYEPEDLCAASPD